jgi:hypothetical protein
MWLFGDFLQLRMLKALVLLMVSSGGLIFGFFSSRSDAGIRRL